MAKINENQIKSLFTLAYEAKKRGESLSNIFSQTAKKLGMSKGSVRNVYYSTLKKAQNDKECRHQFLGENELSANKIVEFNDEESERLLTVIFTGVTFGKSVRRVISENTSDEKTALRYQNKYRNLLKHDKKMVEKVIKQIKAEYGKCYNPYESKPIADFNLARLKKEINSLYDKISQSVREENRLLKEKIKYYENENEKLKSIIEEQINSPINEYFSKRNFVPTSDSKSVK